MRLVFSLVGGTEFLMIYLPAQAPGCILLPFFPTSSGCQLGSLSLFFLKLRILNFIVSFVTQEASSLTQPLSVVSISHSVCVVLTKRVMFSVPLIHRDGKVLVCMFPSPLPPPPIAFSDSALFLVTSSLSCQT